MPTYTIQSILGEQPHQYKDGGQGVQYTVQIAERPEPVRMFRGIGYPPRLGPIHQQEIDGDVMRKQRDQQQTAPQPSATYVPPQQATPYQVAQQPSPDYDQRQHSIIRQHSQDMALQAYPLIFGPTPERVPTPPMIADFLKDLRPLIDWFDADARQKHEPVQAEPSQANTNTQNDDSVPF